MNIDFPLEFKITRSKKTIKEWYEYWNGKVYVSFSGGKDSTVLLHLVRSMYPEVPAVFCDTGLEYPEIKKFIQSVNNVIILKPKINFFEVLKKYGYPVISKEQAKNIYEVRHSKSTYTILKRLYGKGNKYRSGKIPDKWKFMINAPFEISGKCCDVMKKRPAHKFEKETGRKPFIGTMIVDSALRRQSVERFGCNAYEMNNPQSRPMSIWEECDVWEYIKRNELKYSKIYDMGESRTGCMFCLFGLQFEKYPTRFDRMKETHPKLYDYCMKKLKLKEVIDFIKAGPENKNQMKLAFKN